jgi:carboxylate-amine ligase
MSGSGRYKAFSGYGIELEYMIVDTTTLEVRPISDVILRDVNGAIQNELEFEKTCWSNELVKHVIELKTNGPAVLSRDLIGSFQSDLKKINAILSREHCCIMPTAMHPFFDPQKGVKLWEHDAAPIYEAYNRIFDCRGHGWSNLQSMHINLPFYDDQEFESLHAAVRVVLPILPALAASSPIYESKISGYADSRLEFYRHNQKKIPAIAGYVIPEQAWSKAQYHDVIYKKILEQIKPHDKDGILEVLWLNSRGAIARFDRNAIEIRVLDVQESPRMDIAIAAVVTTLVKSLVDEKWVSLDEQKMLSEIPMHDIFVSTLKSGSATVLSDKTYLKVFNAEAGITVKDLWRKIIIRLEEQYPCLIEPFAEEIRVLTTQGNLSDRILRQLKGTFQYDAVATIYNTLCKCAQQDKIFS